MRSNLLALVLVLTFCSPPIFGQICLKTLVNEESTEEELLRAARGYAAQLMERQGSLKTPDPGGFQGGKLRLDTYGVPSHLSLIQSTPGQIFRHFISGRYQDKQHFNAQEVLESLHLYRRLVAGPTPYVKSDYPPKWYKEAFHDLTGIFLTKPEQEAEHVGVFANPWIDVILFPGTPLIEIEKDRIFLLPGPPGKLVVPFTMVKNSAG